MPNKFLINSRESNSTFLHMHTKSNLLLYKLKACCLYLVTKNSRHTTCDDFLTTTEVYTINKNSLTWLKFVANLVNSPILPNLVHQIPIILSSICGVLDKIYQTLCCQIDCYAVLPHFSHAKLSSFTVTIRLKVATGV